MHGEDRADLLLVARDLGQNVIRDVVSEELFVHVLGSAATWRPPAVDKPLHVRLYEADSTGSIRSIKMFRKEVEQLDNAGMNTLILRY